VRLGRGARFRDAMNSRCRVLKGNISRRSWQVLSVTDFENVASDSSSLPEGCVFLDDVAMRSEKLESRNGGDLMGVSYGRHERNPCSTRVVAMTRMVSPKQLDRMERLAHRRRSCDPQRRSNLVYAEVGLRVSFSC